MTNRKVLVFLFVAFLPFLLIAQTNKEKAEKDTAKYFIKLKEFVISEFHTPKSYSENTRTLLVIPKSQLNEIPASTVNDVVENFTTADIRRRGISDVQSDINIRGGTFEQTLILLNGIPVNDPQTGHHNLDLPLTKYDISKVELLYGPGAALYGPNSFNGALNITTYNFTNSYSAKFYAEGGSYNSYILGTKAEASGTKAGITLSASKEASDGYMENTDYRIHNLLIQPFVKTGEKSKIYGLFGYKNKQFGANKFYSPKFPEMYESTETYIASLQYIGGENIKYSPSVFYKAHYDDFLLKRFDPSFYENIHLTQLTGLDFPFFVMTPIGKTSFGGGYKTESIISNRLGEISKEIHYIKGDSVNKFSSRQNSYFSVNQEVNIEKFYGNAGFFVNANNEYSTRFYPELNLSYKIFKGVKLYANYSSSFRIPSFTELYYLSPTVKGNTKLKPEEANTYEAGFKVLNDFAMLNLAVFQRKTKNFIDLAQFNNNDTLYFINNPGIVTTTGIDINTQLQLQNFFESNFAVKSISLAYQYITKNDFDYISYYANNYLRYKISSLITFSYNRMFFLDVNFISKHRNGGFYDKNSIYRNYTPVNLLNIKLSYKRGLLTVFAEADNVTDEEYYDFGWIPMPGRFFKAGIVFEISKLNK